MNQNARDVVLAFVEAINRQNPAEMEKLMSEDHLFVDSRDTHCQGLETMIAGWKDYFGMFPDYCVTIDTILSDGDLVAAFGRACGTYNGKRGLAKDNRIEMPAAWRARVKDGKITYWQVYADWTEGVRIIEEDEKTGG